MMIERGYLPRKMICRYTLPSEFDRVTRARKATRLEVRGDSGRPPIVNRPGDPEIAALLEAMKDASQQLHVSREARCFGAC